jgi:hypothetical protein
MIEVKKKIIINPLNLKKMNENLKPMEQKEPNLSNVKLDQELKINNMDLDKDSTIRNNASTIVNADKINASK